METGVTHHAEIDCFRHPQFEIGDAVVLDNGAEAVILGIYRDFAWIFEDVNDFETVEISTLRRADDRQKARI